MSVDVAVESAAALEHAIFRQRHRGSGSDESGDGCGGGLVDRDGGSGLFAVELSRVATAAAVNHPIETAAVASWQ